MTGPLSRRRRARTALARLHADLGRDAGALPAWARRTAGEPRLPVLVALLAAIALQAALPRPVLFAPRWAVIVPELLLLVVLVAGNPVRLERDTARLRAVSIALTALILGANATSGTLLVRDLVLGHSSVTKDPATLLASGALIYLTAVVAFGLLYWEFDRGGSVARAQGRQTYPDFVFPQMTTPELAHPEWEPTVVDYLYVSVTNMTAFSPTDTMPYSRWAKTLMLLQSLVALVVVGLVIARAVNILP